MQKSNSPLIRFILLILVAVAGIGIGLVVKDGLLYFYKTGVFSSWGFLDGFGWLKRLPSLFCAPAGLILSVLIFVAFQKGEAKQLTLNIISNIFSAIGYSVIGAGIGLIVGIGIVRLEQSGVFISWKLLDGPVKFSQIVHANTNVVWAQSVDDKLYSWGMNCYSQPECNEWVEVVSVSDNVDYMLEHGLIKIGDSCQLGASNSPKKQPGNVVECALVQLGMYESSWTVYYALLDDGSIWSWKYTSNLYAFIFTPLISFLVGTLLGAITGIIIVSIRHKKKNQSQLSPSTSEPLK